MWNNLGEAEMFAIIPTDTFCAPKHDTINMLQRKKMSSLRAWLDIEATFHLSLCMGNLFFQSAFNKTPKEQPSCWCRLPLLNARSVIEATSITMKWAIFIASSYFWNYVGFILLISLNVSSLYSSLRTNIMEYWGPKCFFFRKLFQKCLTSNGVF